MGDLERLERSFEEKLEELEQDLKNKFNSSMEELVRAILGQKKRIAALEQRLQTYNSKAGHKI